MLEEEIGPLSNKEKRFVQVVGLCQPERFMTPFQWTFIGRISRDSTAMAYRWGVVKFDLKPLSLTKNSSGRSCNILWGCSIYNLTNKTYFFSIILQEAQ